MSLTLMLGALRFSVSTTVFPKQRAKSYTSTGLPLFQTVLKIVYTVRTNKENVLYV